MAQPALDPGYGDPNAPVGTVEWAKHWRLGFQLAVKDLPQATTSNRRYFDIGNEHRAWTLLTDREGKKFPDFDSFCRTGQPWGLGVDPAKFRTHLAAEVGDKAADLETVSPGDDEGGHHSLYAGATGAPALDGMSARKAKNLRAIIRAPEVVQELYKDDRLTQKDAARLGPKSPTPDQASRIAEARQDLEQLDRGTPRPKFRKQAREVIDRHFGRREPSPLDLLRRAWAKASAAQRRAFLAEVTPADEEVT